MRVKSQRNCPRPWISTVRKRWIWPRPPAFDCGASYGTRHPCSRSQPCLSHFISPTTETDVQQTGPLATTTTFHPNVREQCCRAIHLIGNLGGPQKFAPTSTNRCRLYISHFNLMPSRKDLTMSMEDAPGSANAPLLQRIRQMWQFANLCQWIYIFGKAAKIDESLEIDVCQLISALIGRAPAC